jgi:CHASE2 domain-containing sensor protein
MKQITRSLQKAIKNAMWVRYLAATIVAFLLLSLLRFITFNMDAFNPIARGLKGFSTTDIFYDMMLASPADTSDVIVIVDITQLHDRDSIATALEEIDALEPAAIDVDVVFEYPKEPVGDMHLVSVAATLSNAVFSFKMMDPDRERKEFTRQAHSFFAEDLGIKEGFVNVDRSMVRDIPLCLKMQGKNYPSVTACMMEVLQGKPFDFQQQQKMPIDYTPTVFRVIPYDSIQHYAQYITGHVVMFGGAYESIDMVYTPLGQMHGIKVLCYAIKTMLEKRQQIDCTGWLYWLLTFLFSYLSVCCILSYRQWLRAKSHLLQETRKKGITHWLKSLTIDILNTTFFVSVVIFFLMSTSIFIDYIIFHTWSIHFDLTPTLSVMALTLISADFVNIIIKYSHIK